MNYSSNYDKIFSNDWFVSKTISVCVHKFPKVKEIYFLYYQIMWIYILAL